MAFAYLFIGCLLAFGVLWGLKYVLMPFEPEIKPNTTTTTTTTTAVTTTEAVTAPETTVNPTNASESIKYW
ncbi:unnamed protein product, partial [Brenthis ino]